MIASVTKAPECPRLVGGKRPVYSGLDWSGSLARSAAAAVPAGDPSGAADPEDPSGGPGTGRRYSGSSRGAISLPRAVGQVVRTLVEGVVDGLDHALGAPEPVAHLSLRD